MLLSILCCTRFCIAAVATLITADSSRSLLRVVTSARLVEEKHTQTNKHLSHDVHPCRGLLSFQAWCGFTTGAVVTVKQTEPCLFPDTRQRKTRLRLVIMSMSRASSLAVYFLCSLMESCTQPLVKRCVMFSIRSLSQVFFNVSLKIVLLERF